MTLVDTSSCSSSHQESIDVVISGGVDQCINAYDVNSGKHLLSVNMDSPVLCMDTWQDHLACGMMGGSHAVLVLEYQSDSIQVTRQILEKYHSKYIVVVQWSSDGSLLCTISQDQKVCLYNRIDTQGAQNGRNNNSIIQRFKEIKCSSTPESATFVIRTSPEHSPPPLSSTPPADRPASCHSRHSHSHCAATYEGGRYCNNLAPVPSAPATGNGHTTTILPAKLSDTPGTVSDPIHLTGTLSATGSATGSDAVNSSSSSGGGRGGVSHACTSTYGGDDDANQTTVRRSRTRTTSSDIVHSTSSARSSTINTLSSTQDPNHNNNHNNHNRNNRSVNALSSSSAQSTATDIASFIANVTLQRDEDLAASISSIEQEMAANVTGILSAEEEVDDHKGDRNEENRKEKLGVGEVMLQQEGEEAILTATNHLAHESDYELVIGLRDCAYLLYVDCATFATRKVSVNENAWDEHVSFTPLYLTPSPDQKYLLIATDTHLHIVVRVGTHERVCVLCGHESGEYGKPIVSWAVTNCSDGSSTTSRKSGIGASMHQNSPYIYSTSHNSSDIYVYNILDGSHTVLSGESSATIYYGNKNKNNNDDNRTRDAATVRGHTGIVRSLQCHPNRNLLVSASYDKSIILWAPIANTSTNTND